MATLKDLAIRFRSLKKEIAEAESKHTIEVAMDVVEYLTQHTPVDTATAVSNWNIGLGRPYRSFSPPYVFGSREGSAQAVKNVAWSMLQLRKPGQKIYISNITPYITYLERGHSSQAPKGFVQQALLYAKVKSKDKGLKI